MVQMLEREGVWGVSGFGTDVRTGSGMGLVQMLEKVPTIGLVQM